MAEGEREGVGIGGKIKDLYEDEKRRIAEKVRGPACRRRGNSQHRSCTLTSAETTIYVHDEGWYVCAAQGITGALAEHKT